MISSGGTEFVHERAKRLIPKNSYFPHKLQHLNFEPFFKKLDAFVTKCFSGRWWKWQVALFCAFYCLITAPADYTARVKDHPLQYEWWRAINYQVDHTLGLPQFLKDNNVSPADHAAKRNFRITMPLIGKIFPNDFQARIDGFMILQFLFGILFFYMVCLWAFRQFSD